MRSRRRLLTMFALVGTAGCLEPPVTGSPPSRPQGSFEFAFRTVDGAELVRITATNVSGDPSGLRVRIGDTVAYTDGDTTSRTPPAASTSTSGATGSTRATVSS